MFSELLKHLRKEKGVTQPQLADAIGVSKGNVGDWETGKSRPGFDAIIALAQYFDVSADYLLGLRTRVKPPLDDNNTLSDEQALLDVYRILEPRDQEEIKQIAKMKAERSKTL